MLTIPSLAVPASAATNPIQSFANNLLLILPPVLFILSLIALRKADYDYAFTLLLAAIIVTAALAGFQGRVSSYALLFYNLQVGLVGPTSTSVNSPVSYSVVTGTLPAGWNVQKIEYNWLIYYNSSILVFNSSSGYVNGYYVNNVQSSQNSLSFTPTQLGTYLVTYSIIEFANVSGYPGYASGGAGGTLRVTTPSPLSWIAGAVESAISSFVSTVLGAILSAMSFLGQLIFDVLSYGLTLPTVSGALGNIVENIYNELLQISISLSLLFIAGSVAYNALKSNYTDLVDIASDLFYKIGVWMLFSFGGLEIYNYVAIFLNSLIYEIINPYLPLLFADVTSGLDLWIGLGLTDAAIPFGFGEDLGVLLGDIFDAMIFFSVLVIVRYFLILAIVALIPLLATLWIFEWTRGIADMLVDVLIGLALAGLLNTTIITLIVASGAFWAFVILPLVADIGTIISLMMSLITIRPHERLSFSPRKGSGSRSQSAQTQPAQTTAPQTTPTNTVTTNEEKKVERIYYM
jgi:hypothetical protein